MVLSDTLAGVHSHASFYANRFHVNDDKQIRRLLVDPARRAAAELMCGGPDTKPATEMPLAEP
jgi:hypothetical protein